MYHDGTAPRLVSRQPWEGQSVVVATAEVVVTASATPHTMGAWTEVHASTSGVADLLRVVVQSIGVSASARAALVDVGVGAVGAEVVVAAGVAVGSAATGPPWLWFDLPIQVPAGTRIAARLQGQQASQTATVRVTAMCSPWPSLAPTSLDVLGTSPATSLGTSVSSAGTWVQVVASSARAYRALQVLPSLATNAATAAFATLDVGVGAVGAEVVAGTNRVYRHAGELCYRDYLGLGLPSCGAVHVPAGSRIAVRDSLGGSGAGACVIGVPL